MDELEEGEIGEDSIVSDSLPTCRRKSKPNVMTTRSKSHQRKFSRNAKDLFKSVDVDLRRKPRVEPVQRNVRQNISRFRKPPDILISSRTTNRLSSQITRVHRLSPMGPPTKNYIANTAERRNTRNSTKYFSSCASQVNSFKGRERRLSCVESPSHDATYEDLLQQYRQIRRELNNITQEEERHDKENRKNQSSPRRRRSVSRKAEKQPPVLEEEDDLFELRQKALASLSKKTPKNNVTKNQKQQQEDWNAVADELLEENFMKVAVPSSTDNYEAVDMELDSEGIDEKDDDEFLLREQLLMAMKKNKNDDAKEEPVEPPPPPAIQERSKLVINLAEDSSDDSDEDVEEANRAVEKMELPAGLDHFLKATRLKVEQQQKAKKREEELKLLRQGMTTFSPLTSLSKAQQAEYLQLKEEIAKRECGKKPQQQTNPLAAYEERLCKERAALMEERQKLTNLHLQALGKRKEVRVQQLRLQKMKEQMAALKKVLSVGLTGLQRIRNQMQFVQNLVETRVSTVRTLNRECLQLGRAVRGTFYKLPPSVPRKRRISSSVPVVATKRLRADVGKLVAEKERLLQLEKEVAQRLQQLRNNQAKVVPVVEKAPPSAPEMERTLKVPDRTTLPFSSYNWIASRDDKMCDLVSPFQEIDNTKHKRVRFSRSKESRLTVYSSCLLHLHSSRLNPYYETREGQLLSSTSHANLVDPGRHLCRFDLLGKCNDDKCVWQHAEHYQSSKEDVVADLASYMPNIESSEEAYKFARILLSKNPVKDLEDSCRDLVCRLRGDCKLVKPHFVRLEKRRWRPVGERKVPMDQQDSTRPKVCKVLMRPEDFDPDANLSEEDVRYFSGAPNRLTALESSVAQNDSDVKMWLKLAEYHLTSGGSENRLERTMDVLSRALEKNRSSPELWLRYLHLYAKHRRKSDLPSICQQALQFCRSYDLWWKYLQVAESYESKVAICSEIVSFLVSEVDEEMRPVRLLQVFLFAVQLSVQSGHFLKARSFFESTLLSGSDQVDGRLLTREQSSHLGTHLPLLWLCYIHMLVFRRLPSCLFQDDNPGRLFSTDNFLISWPEREELPISVESLRAVLINSLDDCRKRDISPAIVDFLLFNLIAFECRVNSLDAAILCCRKFLKDDSKRLQLWIFIVTLCRKENDTERAQQLLLEAISEFGHVPALCNTAARFYLSLDRVESAISCLRDGLPDHLAKDGVDSRILQSYTSVLESGRIADPVERSYVVANRLLVSLCSNVDTSEMLSGCNLMEKNSAALCFQITEQALKDGSPTSLANVHYVLKGLLLSADHSRDFLSLLDFFCAGLADPADYCNSLLTQAPNNVQLVDRTIRLFLESGNREMALNVLRRFLGSGMGTVAWMWKLAIEESLAEKDHQEVHRLFGLATQALPFSADLWNEYARYEKSLAHREHADSVLERCRKIQVQTSFSS